MALLKIDGADLPSPGKYNFIERDLAANSGRNANGTANWDVVRTNVGEISLSWENVSRDKITAICNVIRNKKSFSVTFLNTLTGAAETRTFYAGDRANELVAYISGLQYWSSLSVSFIEV
jgi:hypothetical protein